MIGRGKPSALDVSEVTYPGGADQPGRMTPVLYRAVNGARIAGALRIHLGDGVELGRVEIDHE